MNATEQSADVVVVGAGPAGLTAARTLAANTSTRVLVLEREGASGGIPRHSDHTGYGMRDQRIVTTGPKYAARLTERARDAGAVIMPHSTVTGWADDRTLWLTSPAGRTQVRAPAIILATGARERPRAARMIPGGRPAGVYTTGELQNAVHLHQQKIGKKAVILGAELVSWSAVLTLRKAGCRATTLVTSHHRPEAYFPIDVVGQLALGASVARRHRVVSILGRDRVMGVEVESLVTGARRIIDCDTVVTTADWIPDNELAHEAGLILDPGSRGPRVDAAGRTSRAGVFAAGNVVHPVDTADVAALSGQHVARAVVRFLEGSLPTGPQVRVTTTEPFVWSSPGYFQPGLGGPARHRIQTWVRDFVRFPRVVVRQDGRIIARRSIPWPASPGRVFRLPWNLLDDASGAGGPIEISL